MPRAHGGARLLGVLVALLLVATASAQEGEISVTIHEVDDSAFPEVSVLITANGPAGPLTGLVAEEVTATELFEDAEVLSVEGATEADVPLALVLVIDISGSMAGFPMVQAQEAAVSLVESLSPGDAVAVVSFASTVEVVQPLTTELEEAVAAVQGLVAAGNTALYDAVAQGAALADESGFQRSAVVLFSDGADFGGISAFTREASLQTAAASEAVFYVIGYGPDIDLEYLELLAEAGSGGYFPAAVAQEIGVVFGEIETVLRSQYVVRLQSLADDAARDRAVSIGISRGDLSGALSTEYASQRPDPTPTPEPSPTPTPEAAVPEPEDDEPAVSDDTEGTGAGAALQIVLPLLAAGIVVGGGVLAVRRRRAAAAQRRRDELAMREHFLERSELMERERGESEE